MFPISMAAQHRHLAGALAKIVSQSENVDDLITFLEGLGRDHRKFGVVAEHYDAGGSRACWRPWNISRGRPGRAERLFPGPAFPRYPTVEVRVADVCPGVGAAALAAAARQGLAGAGIDPFTGQAVDAPVLRSRLLDHVYPRAHRARRHRDDHRAAAPARPAGDRAGRQRALFTSGASTPAFITALARATPSGYEPARPRPPTARAGPGGSAMAVRESPAGKPVAGAAALRPGPGPRAGPDGDPGHAGAGDRRPGPGHRCGAERRVGRCRGRGRRGLLAAAGGDGGPRDDPRRDGQHGSDQRSHRAAAPGPGLSTP